jgi:hypothetical protein
MAMIIRDSKSAETIVQLTKLCEQMLKYTSTTYFPLNEKISAILIDTCLDMSVARDDKWMDGYTMVNQFNFRF